MSEENQLTIVAKESGLEPSKVENLLSKFADSFASAKQISQDSSELVVTSEGQVEEMALARTQRLKLKNIRVEVEHTRKKLKEQSLREGKAIDGMANIIKALIVPVEERLEQQEKFAEIKEAERKAKRHADRIEKLSPWVEDVSVYSLEDMSDETFDALLENAKIAEKARKEAEEKAEQDRIAKEKADAEEQERIRKENEKLRKEAELKEAKQRLLTDRINKVAARGLIWSENDQSYALDDFNISLVELKTLNDAVFDKTLVKIDTEIERRIDEQKKADAEKQAVIEADRKKREALEKEKEEREAAEAKKKIETEEAARQALLAPDKEKLVSLANEIDSLTMPNVADREAGKVLDETKDFLIRISKNLRKKASEL